MNGAMDRLPGVLTFSTAHLLNFLAQVSLIALIGLLMGRLMLKWRGDFACRLQRCTIMMIIGAMIITATTAFFDYRHTLPLIPGAHQVSENVSFDHLSGNPDSTGFNELGATMEPANLSTDSHHATPTVSAESSLQGPGSTKSEASRGHGADELLSTTKPLQSSQMSDDRSGPSPSRMSIATILIAIVFAWSMLGLLRLAMSVRGLNRLKRTAFESSEWLRSSFDKICLEYALGPVELLVSEQISSPCTLGIWKRCVLMPRSWLNRPRLVIDVALRHELTHVVRRDAKWIFIAETIGRLFTWHPIVRLLVGDHRVAIEVACDEEVVESGYNACDYADGLLSAATATPARANILAVPMARSSRIAARVERVLRKGADMNPSRPWLTSAAWFSGVSMAVLLVLGGLVEVGQAVAKSERPEITHKLVADRLGDLQVEGRVLMPDGQPAAGAIVCVRPARLGPNWIWREAATAVCTTETSETGRFTLTIPLDEIIHDARYMAQPPPFAVVASMEDHGEAWTTTMTWENDSAIELTLPSLSHSCQATVVDSEGSPIQGACVWIVALADGNHDSVPESLLSMRGETIPNLNNRALADSYRNSIPGYCLSNQASKLTDRAGNVEFPFVGDHRRITLVVEKPGFEKTVIQALSAPIEPIRWTSSPFPQLESWQSEEVIFGNRIQIAMSQAAEVSGRVIDKETGEPIAGCFVGSFQRSGNRLLLPNFEQTTSDNDGHFVLDEMPIGDGNSVLVEPPIESDYMTTTIQVDPETVSTIVELRKGVRIRGRVSERETDAGVFGYFAVAPTDRDHFTSEELMAIGMQMHLPRSWSTLLTDRDDGSFEVVGPAGGGVLAFFPLQGEFMLSKDRYPRGDMPNRAIHLGMPIIMEGAAVVHEYDAAEQETESLELTVDRGDSLTIDILDETGEPLSGVAFGNDRFPFPSSTNLLDESSLTLEGIGPETNRRLYFMHYEKNIGCCVNLDIPGGKIPDEVRLVPIGQITGRIVDSNGHPCANLYLSPFPSRQGQELTTDAEGRFLLRDVIQGDRVFLSAMDGRTQFTVLSILEVRETDFGDLGDVHRVPYPSK